MDVLSNVLLIGGTVVAAIFQFFNFLVPDDWLIAELPDFVEAVLFIVYIAFAILCSICGLVMCVQFLGKRDDWGCLATLTVAVFFIPISIASITALIGSIIVMVSIGGHPMAAELRWTCSGIIVIVLAIVCFLFNR